MTDVQALIDSIARKHNIDPVLFRALVKQESGFNPRARSGAGAMGLTQLMPGTARGLGVTDPYDPEQNLDGGARYLAQQLKTFGGDPNKALAAYNAGPGAVKKYGGIPPYKETQNYVKSIMSAYKGLSKGVQPQQIASVQPKEKMRTQPTQTPDKGYIGELPRLGSINGILPKLGEQLGVAPDSPTPEADMLQRLGEPLVPQRMPQMQAGMGSGGMGRGFNPISTIGGGVAGAAAPVADKEGFDIMPLRLAMIGTGQSILNSALKGKGADIAGPLSAYIGAKALMKKNEQKDLEKEQKAQEEANVLSEAYRSAGIDIPAGLKTPEQVKELASLNMGVAKAKTEQEYDEKLLQLKERELQHKLEADTGIGSLFNDSKDPALILMGLKNDPEKWGQLSPEVQAKADDYLDLKVKEASKLFEQKFTENQAAQQGKIEGQIGGKRTVADVEEAKAAGKDLAERKKQYIEMKSKMPTLEKTVDKLSKLSEAATYTKAGQFNNELKRQLGVDVGDAGVARKEYESIVNNQILPLLRQTFGAQFTEREGQTLRETLGDVNASPREKQAVLKSFIEQKRMSIEDEARAIELQAGGEEGKSSPVNNDPLGLF